MLRIYQEQSIVIDDYKETISINYLFNNFFELGRFFVKFRVDIHQRNDENVPKLLAQILAFLAFDFR